MASHEALVSHCLAEIARVVAPFRPSFTQDGAFLVDDGVLAFTVVVKAAADDMVQLDVAFIINRDDPRPVIIGDHTSGFGTSIEKQASTAIERWAASTAPVLLELVEQNGNHAANLHADDPQGLHGWHVIQGPVSTWGDATQTAQIQAWLADNPLLPLLEHEILPAIAGISLPSIRIILGGNGSDELAEVQIDGRVDEDTTALLASLDWPRPSAVAFAKIFVLGVHDATD